MLKTLLSTTLVALLLEGAPPRMQPDPKPTTHAGGESVPGCKLVGDIDYCTERGGNLRELNACYSSALIAAQAELDKQLTIVRSDYSDSPSELRALDQAQAAWIAFVIADCKAVGVHWEGRAVQAPEVAGCWSGHTLRRAQAIWSLYIREGQTAVPPSCSPHS